MVSLFYQTFLYKNLIWVLLLQELGIYLEEINIMD